jgi:hypothetical protein
MLLEKAKGMVIYLLGGNVTGKSKGNGAISFRWECYWKKQREW